MPVPAILLLTCLVIAGFAVPGDGPIADAVLLMSASAVVAAACLLAWELWPRPDWVLVDGSNVLHWEDGTPRLGTVTQVVRALEAEGLTPVVWFDANVGYKIGSRYMGDAALAHRLGLPVGQVHVAPKGTPADPLILAQATRLTARVVTNDRFRDWSAEYPAVVTGDGLVRGQARRGGVMLDL